jgi:hypothetical protein
MHLLYIIFARLFMTNILSLKKVGGKFAIRRFLTGLVKHMKKLRRSL